MRIEQNNSGINSGVNSVQQFSALNAFKTNKVLRPAEEAGSSAILEETSSGTKAAPKNILSRVDIADIRKCAEYAGEYDITDDDIKYGLLYGRSVIAEWLC